MKSKLCIIVCENFIKEAETILQNEQYEDVIFSHYPSTCGMEREKQLKRIEEIYLKYKDECNKFFIIGGNCLLEEHKIYEIIPQCEIYKLEQCFYLFTNKDIINKYLNQRAYLVTSGWLQNWKTHIGHMGFNKEIATEFFREFSKKILLLDTGVTKDSSKELVEFSDFVGLPHEKITIGLDYFQLFIEKIIYQWRLKKEKIESSKTLNSINKKSADYAMAFELVNDLSNIGTEKEAIEKVLDLSEMLFATNRLCYTAFNRNDKKEYYCRGKSINKNTKNFNPCNFQEQICVIHEVQGFDLLVTHQGEHLGVLQIEEVAFPEHMEHYFNIAGTIGKVCGLVIANARKYEEVIQARKAINEEKELFSITLSSIGEGLIVTNKDASIVLINKVGEELTGYKKEDTYGKCICEIFNKKHIVTAVREVMISGEQISNREYIDVTFSNAKRADISINVSPITVENGEVIGTVIVFRDITEERKSIKALQESEERYRRIVEMSPNGIFIYSNYIIEYVNKSAIEAIGARHEDELIGKSIMEFIHPQYHKINLERINRMYQNYKPEMLIEEKLITLDGNVIEVEIMSIPLVYGGKLAMMGIASDVTKRNEAERIVKQKDIQLRQITNNMSDIIAQSNTLGIYDYVSPSCEKVLGYKSEEMLGKTCIELVHPEDQRKTLRLFTKILQNCTAQRIEFRYKHAKGYYIWLESIGTPIIDEKGELKAVSYISRDITNRKLIEEKLRENEAQYKKLIEVLPEAIFVHNDNKIVFCNEAAAEIVGVERPEELIDKSVLDLMPMDERDIHLKRFQNVIVEKKVQPFTEARLINNRKEIIDVEVGTNFFPYGGKNNVLDVVRNITDRKQMELLKKNIEESNKLLNETLEYDRLRTEFFSNISHEFRTPLNVILGAVQLWSLYEKNGTLRDDNGKVGKQVKMMKQNCYRLLRLINNLIDITKIDSNFYEINLKNENIVEIVENITLSVAEYIESKGISLQFDTEVEECTLACDSDKIERIMLNLLSNAVKFSKVGSEIFVNIYNRGNEVIISVRDTGIGIPEDKLEVVFERFRQVDKSLTRAHEGSGIGLSLVKSLVELHNGTIEVESIIDKGSEFVITIPIITIEEDIEYKNISNQDSRQSLVERVYVEFSDIYS